ncbi:uncharacterized protein LOC124487189 [Hypomesus transpacificus]|uniref:uncharacterized protein LOC124487189 n=1 Tax=Hypomesus transpacificus TaxID=137520 RepID=UPI001F07B302|nr:uncharacterized protein LOC124487189 [Hypomesus transpacificus]
MIVCLVLSAFEDRSDAFISKRIEFAQVKGSPSTKSVNFGRSHYNPYQSSAEQTTRPEQSTPDAAHMGTYENNRNRRIPAYLLNDFQPRAQQAEMTHWPPREQEASHSIKNLATSFVKGNPQNVQGLYSFTGTRQMKALSERSRPNDVIHKSESGVRPPDSRWARPSQYDGSPKENPSITSTDQLVHGYQLKTRTIDEDLESVVQPVSGATQTHQRVRSGLEVYPGLSIDDASKSIPNNFSPFTQHNPVMNTHGHRHMQPARNRLSSTNTENSRSVNNPISSSNMNPQAGPHYKMHRSSHNNGAPSSQEEFLSQPSHPKVPGVLNRGFDSSFQPVARRYSFGPSDVAPSVPSPTPSPGREPGQGGPLPDRFATHPWEGHTRGIVPEPERSFLTSFQREKMAATYNPGRSTNVNHLHRFQGSNHQRHKPWLVSTVDDVQLSRGAIDKSSPKKSKPENHNFGNTIYEYPLVFKKYGFGKNRATNPTPVRSHSIKMEGLNEPSRNTVTIHKSNESDVKPLAHLAAMPFQNSSSPKENPSNASIDQSVNTKLPFLESGVQPVSSTTLAPQRLGFTVHPHVSTGDDTSKSVPYKFPPTASLGKMDPVITHENIHNPRLFENQKGEFSSLGFPTQSPVSSASKQREGTVAYPTDPTSITYPTDPTSITYPTDPTSITYRENVSDGLGKTQTRHNLDKPGSLPIWQPINHTQLSIMPESSTASPVLDQSTTDPRSNNEIFSQREAALGIYRLRGKKLNRTVGHGPKFTPKNINSTQNSLELPASETRTNAQPVATATDNALATPWRPQPDPEAVVANLVNRTPENGSPVQGKPVPQTAAAKIVPTLYDILYKNPTSSVVRGKLVKGKLPIAQNHNGSFTIIKTHFPPIVGLNKHINSMPIQFADVAGSASFSSIKTEKRPRVGDPLPGLHSPTDAKATANQEGRAQIPAPIRKDLSSRGAFFSVGGSRPRSASRVSKQEGREDVGGDGSVLRPG